MINMRIIERPAFTIIGKQTWIDGPDNEQFGRFWQVCKAEGLLSTFDSIKRQSGQWAGPQTNSGVLGVSRVEKDPANRAFFYMIAIEAPADVVPAGSDLEVYEVPSSQWAVFECHGTPPESIVTSEIYAFSQWLPQSGCQHALAPEMEVYPAHDDPNYCEFWLPIASGSGR